MLSRGSSGRDKAKGHRIAVAAGSVRPFFWFISAPGDTSLEGAIRVAIGLGGGGLQRRRQSESPSVRWCARAEEPVQPRVTADEPQRDPSGAAAHAARDQDDAGQEAPELHGDVLTPLRIAVHHQGKPQLDAPVGRGDHHVHPVADQVVQRHSPGTRARSRLPAPCKPMPGDALPSAHRPAGRAVHHDPEDLVALRSGVVVTQSQMVQAPHGTERPHPFLLTGIH